jgi:hypothetical protein
MYNNDPKYMNPQQGLASLVNSPYGDSDVMQVKMTPREVAGLQQLAMSYGANEQDLYDPVTGQPKFSFLKKILPMVAGAILPGIPGVGAFAKTIGFGSQALGSALLVGGVTGLIEGDLKKGLMAGLGAYSGAKIGEGLTAAGKATSQVATAPPPSTLAQQLGLKESDLISPTGFDSTQALGVNIPDTSGPLPAVSPMQAADVVQTVTQRQPPTGVFGTMGQGARNLFASDATGDAARKAFGETFSNPLVRSATLMGGLAAITPEQKPLSVPGMGEDIMYIPGGPNPLYGTGADQPPQLPGKYYKRTAKGLVPYNPYQMAPGYAQGGAIDMTQEGALPRQDVMPYPQPNQNYPLSTVVRANYSPAMPRPREVVGGYGPKIDPFTGEEKFAEGGDVKEDPNVAANRAYVEELNRRAMKPTFTPYGMLTGGTGALGGTNAPWTGTNPYGGALNTTTGGQQKTTGGGTEDALMNLAAMYGIQQGLGSLTGNAAFQEWLTKMGLKKAGTTTGGTTTGGTTTGGTTTGQTTGQQTQTGGETGGQQTQTGGETGGQQTTTGGEGQPYYDPLKNIVVAGGTGAAAVAAAQALAAKIAGTTRMATVGIQLVDGSIIPVSSSAITGGAAGAGAAGAGTGAATTGATTGATTTGATTGAGTQTGIASTLKGGATAAGTAAAAAAALIGAHQAYQGISKGREGQAAAGGALAGAGGAYLAGASGLGGAGLTSLAGFGPIGLAAAAIAAIGASLVNTKEYGDVALRNYWNAVDAGRGIGQTDPNELAQGFINFYRTNKNEFAGQAKYGRTGNEDFVYDMTQVINNAVKDGKVGKDVDAATMYKEVVQPWLNTMGEGPKNEEARAIQDFMMTDLINSFMQGKPISNAQVKGDKKFKIVSEKPVYAGVPTTQEQTPAAQDDAVRQAIEAYGMRGGFPAGVNPYGVESTMPFGDTMRLANGGSIGEDYNFGFAGGGMSEYKAGGKLLNGPGDGMSDSIPAVIRGKGVQRAALADGEFVVPADVVSHLGNGSTKAGAKKLYVMMDKVRQARTGRTRQAPAVKTDRFLPA